MNLNLNKEYELKLLPGETLDEFMILWSNRLKNSTSTSSDVGSHIMGVDETNKQEDVAKKPSFLTVLKETKR